MPSTAFVPADTTAGYFPHDRAVSVRSCAIHQPNLLPRLSTLAKLYASDVWVILDDVQFVRRDYQHRARLAALDDPTRRQWLSLATHLPQGRSTLIRDARLADPEVCRRRMAGLSRQYYGRSRHWPSIQKIVDPVLSTRRPTASPTSPRHPPVLCSRYSAGRARSCTAARCPPAKAAQPGWPTWHCSPTAPPISAVRAACATSIMCPSRNTPSRSSLSTPLWIRRRPSGTERDKSVHCGQLRASDRICWRMPSAHIRWECTAPGWRPPCVRGHGRAVSGQA